MASEIKKLKMMMKERNEGGGRFVSDGISQVLGALAIGSDKIAVH